MFWKFCLRYTKWVHMFFFGWGSNFACTFQMLWNLYYQISLNYLTFDMFFWLIKFRLRYTTNTRCVCTLFLLDDVHILHAPYQWFEINITKNFLIKLVKFYFALRPKKFSPKVHQVGTFLWLDDGQFWHAPYSWLGINITE